MTPNALRLIFPRFMILSALVFFAALDAGRTAADSPPAGAPVETARPAPPQASTAPADDQRAADRAAETDRVTLRSTQSPPRPLPTDRPSAIIREPSQGRPIFITPGETFFFVMRLPPGLTGEVSLGLRHSLEPSIRVPLRATTPPSYFNNEYCNLVLEIPPATPPGLYDIEVRSPRETHAARRSVCVVDSFKTRFRFVHLSNMNIGDLTAPNFDEMLIREINLLAPEFIVATGNYTEWARARDDAGSWARVLKFFEQFHAPVFMLCGLTDHEASFTEFVAKQPIGTIDYGHYHGLLLLDHPGNPIDQDLAQVAWVEEDLKRNRDKTFNFLVAHSDELALLDIWRERGGIEQFVKDHKLKLFIVGGSTDWDYKEFAHKLKGLDDFHLIRTHQASTSLRDRATGFSHYRVIEVDGDRVDYVYADDTAAEKLQHSIPTGRLRAYYEAPNDGSASRVAVTLQNALNQRFADARLWIRVAKSKDGRKPIVEPGRVRQMIDVGDYWACDVAVDLPDKGGVRIVAATDPAAVPAPLPITVELDGEREWVFNRQVSDFGLSYYTSETPVTLKLTNTSAAPQTCWPVVRINGSLVYADRTASPRLPLTIEPGKSVSVPLALNLRRISPGPHTMQVYFLDDPLSRLQTFDVRLTAAAATAEAPQSEP